MTGPKPGGPTHPTPTHPPNPPKATAPAPVEPTPPGQPPNPDIPGPRPYESPAYVYRDGAYQAMAGVALALACWGVALVALGLVAG